MQRPEAVPSGAWWSPDDDEWIYGDRDSEGGFHGLVQYYRPDGSLVCETEFVNGEAHGLFRRYHETGEVSRLGRFELGAPDGGDSSYRASGETTETSFPHQHVAHEVVRLTLKWQQGTLLFQSFYDADDREVLPSGKPFPERPAGVPEVAYLNVSESGVRWEAGAVKDGKRSGVWCEYDGEGVFLGEVEYQQGRLYKRLQPKTFASDPMAVFEYGAWNGEGWTDDIAILDRDRAPLYSMAQDSDFQEQGRLISELRALSNPEYDAFVAHHELEAKLERYRKEHTLDALIGIKGMFTSNPVYKELGALKLGYPDGAMGEAELHVALIAEAETQGVFLSYIATALDDAFPATKQRIIANLAEAKPDFDGMLKAPKNQEYLGAIKKIRKAVTSYLRSLVIKPAEFDKIEAGFGVVLGKELSQFDQQDSQYRHYVHHEFLAADFAPFLYPDGIRSLPEQVPAFQYGGDSYYHLPRSYEFERSLFDVCELLAELPATAKKELESSARDAGDSLYVTGETLGRTIIKHELDLREEGSLNVIAQVKTDGSLKDALLTTLLHVDRDLVEYGDEIEVTKEGKAILKGIKGKQKKLFRAMLVTEECARDAGYYFHGPECGAYEFEVLLQDSPCTTIACWEMSESVYSFIVIREPRENVAIAPSGQAMPLS